MKRFIPVFLCFAIVTAISGCSPRPESSSQKTAEKTTSQEIHTDQTTSTTSETDTASASQKSENSIIKNSDLTKYKKQIAALTKKINGTAVSKNQNTNVKYYQDFKQDIDLIENQLDRLDDIAEQAYHADTISFQKYTSWNKSIDTLEDQLDFAEDTLEHKYQIDD